MIIKLEDYFEQFLARLVIGCSGSRESSSKPFDDRSQATNSTGSVPGPISASRRKGVAIKFYDEDDEDRTNEGLSSRRALEARILKAFEPSRLI